jgi:phage-related holin
MDFAELFSSAKGTAANLVNNGAVKFVGASIVGAACSMHGQLLLAFVGLIIIDLVTKWIALSKEYLTKRKRKKNVTLWQCVVNIPAARSAGYIKSEAMKHRFLGKIIVYLLVVFAGALADNIMMTMGKPQWAVVLLVGYLSVTELISILENLQDAGVEEAGQLHDILEKRREQIK